MSSLVDKMFKWPHHVEYYPFDVGDGRCFNLKLIPLDLHPLDLVGIVIPHELCRLLDTHHLLH
jgi:hypothetical protein